MRQDRVLKDRKPSTLITNFGADGVDIKGSFWVKDPEKGTGVLKSAIMKEILVRFAEEGIEIPYAKREVKLSGSVELRR
jgi:small-conductance mechanosensitive channel